MFCGWGWEKLGWVGSIPWDGVGNGGIGDVLTSRLVEFGLGWFQPMGWGQKAQNWGHSIIGVGGI